MTKRTFRCGHTRIRQNLLFQIHLLFTPPLLLLLLHLYYYSYSYYYNILRMSTWQVVISYYCTCRLVLKSGRRLIWDPANPELKPDRVEKKIEVEKSRYDPTDSARSGQKFGCNPLTFVFLLKRRRFDLKKMTRATRSKPRTLILDRAGSKNYV